ncbi:MAG: NAD(P)H-hydrate dehydratase [Planctomycetota bacterium]|nr:NAD(P)H-hydrate dehydratase [Planctomycetota bacterium]
MSGQALPSLVARDPESHKGHFGSAMLIGGARGMAGAIGLSAIAALRSGAGRSTALVPRGIQSTVASLEPSIMTRGLEETEAGTLASEATSAILASSDAMSAGACGPGLGRDAELRELVITLYAELPIPCVFDADALFALSGAELSTAAAPRILTPHAGEWARLRGTTAAPRAEAEADVRQWAAEHREIVVLKGHRTLVTDGRQEFYNHTGNAGMATAGSGDVLTGMITGLLAQGMSPWDAARLGVHLHGAAGDLACERLGEVGMIASDLLHSVAIAFKNYGGER